MCPDEWLTALGMDLNNESARAKVESLQWQLTERLLQLGTSVIIEWGTWSQSERENLRVHGQALGALVELHFLNPPTAQLFQRIQRRNREAPPMELADLLEWTNQFEPPTSEELLRYDGWWISDGTTIHHS
jgi:predicted kinase